MIDEEPSARWGTHPRHASGRIVRRQSPIVIARVGVQKKGGVQRAPPSRFDGEFGYRFLAAFFFPPLAAFFAMLSIPPFLGSSVCE